MNKKRQIHILVFLIFLWFIINYSFLNSALENFLSDSKSVHVERVIDGDTVVTSDGIHIRLLGINAPETHGSVEPYGEAATTYLTKLINGKNVTLKFTADKTDKYGRTLAYIFLGSENVNALMVEKGLANVYFYSGKDQYSDAIENAWNTCLQNKANLCSESQSICATGNCFKLNRDYVENSCDFSCNVNGWYVKVEGRAKVILNGSMQSKEKIYFNLSLADSGGSLFLRDENGSLVLWGNY